jgi:hypothetical protein
MIWFINNAAAPGDGRLSSPFNSLAAFQAVNNGNGTNPKANQNIFIYESGANYVGPVTLLTGQKLIGQDATATLQAISGITPPAGSAALPSMNSGNGTLVTITNTAANGNGIVLGSGNTLRGFTVGNTNGSDITGGAVGSLAVSDVSLTGTGQAFVITTSGALNVALNSLSSTSGTNGVSLTGCTGSFTANGGSINGPTGADFLVSGGTVNIAYAGAITNTAGRSIDIQNRTGGTVAFSGAISDSGTGIHLNSNTGATITFSGGLNLNTGASAAFTATNGGTVNATQNNTTILNTLTTTTGTALNVANTTIGASGLTFRSISANGATKGISLNTTGAGALTVTGTGTTNGSGGTIQNITERGIELIGTGPVSLANIALNNANTTDSTTALVDLSSAANLLNPQAANGAITVDGVNGLTLDNIDIAGTAQMGIAGRNVTNFQLKNSSITNAGNGTAGAGGAMVEAACGSTTFRAQGLIDNTEHLPLAGEVDQRRQP